MKHPHTILLTFWLVHPEGDRHRPDQMRALGDAGVYAPEFQTGERRLMAMKARFDINDERARNAAIEYAQRNVFLLHGPENVCGFETYLNGEKI